MNLQKACRRVAKQLNEDYELVRDVVNFLFYFTAEVMKDPEDTHDILFNKLFKFKLKPKFKQNKS